MKAAVTTSEVQQPGSHPWRSFWRGFWVGCVGITFLIALVAHVHRLGNAGVSREQTFSGKDIDQFEGREVELFDVASEALVHDPDDVEAHYVKGIVRLKMGQPVAALRHLDRVVRMAPAHDLAWRARSRAQEQIGDLSGARASRAKVGDRP